MALAFVRSDTARPAAHGPLHDSDRAGGAIANICRLFEPVTYAIMRAAFGLILFTHGLPKITGRSHGSVADPFSSVMHQVQDKLHLPCPTFFAYCVAAIETVGALCLAAGFLTRLAAPMIAVEMAVICLIDYPSFNWLERGMEYALLMGLVALHISMRGGGPFSVDRLLGGPAWLVGPVTGGR